MPTSFWGSANVSPVGTHRFPVDVSAAGAPSHVTIADLVSFTQLEGYGLDNVGSITGAATFTFSVGRYTQATVIGNVTISFADPPSGAFVQVIRLTNGGAFTVTWPAAVSWAGGTAPTLRSSGVDIIRLYSVNGGTSYIGELAYDEQSFQAGIQWQEEGSNLGASGTATTVNFVGAAVTAARSTDTITVTIDAPTTARSISTQHSLTGGGDLSADRTLSLVNDTASPGNNKVYGTDGSGVRGWKSDPAGGGSPGGSGSEIQYRSGASSFGGAAGTHWDSTNSRLSIGAGTSPGAKTCVTPGASTEVGVRVDGASGQTAALQEWRNSSGTIVAAVFVDKFQPSSLAATTFVNDGGSLAIDYSGAKVFYINPGEINGYGASKVAACIKHIATRSSSGGLANNFGSESGGTVTNTGATARVDCDLPERTGYTVDVYIDDADGMRLTCAAGDKIRCMDKETSTGGYLQSTTLGSFVRLQRIKSGQWAVLAIGGVWTDGTFTFDNTADTTP